ncbi:MAG: hypothetical protein A2173_02445 [Planctomycetes bacterium RBG_13_44_8b]|nr:MAG: hypothetical protein A2173_02445 [Planctomycetes bacterium RBG_13_44_8b]
MYVYHYTNDEGFKGIIESQELWATSIYHLNDWKEFDYGRDALVNSVKDLLENNEAADAGAKLLSYLYDTHPSLFVCSFSAAEDGDDLAQWRAYSHNGGYAIGFPIDKLISHANILKFDWFLCEYGTKSTDQFVQKLANIIEQIFKMAGGVKQFNSQFPFNDPTNDPLLAILLKFVAKYKHDAFKAEKEHRFVRLLTSIEHPRFRMSGSSLIPYVAFSLKNKDLWKQAQIVMSPCLPNAAKLRFESVKEFLKSELSKHKLPTDCAISVRLSKAPYRNIMGG